MSLLISYFLFSCLNSNTEHWTFPVAKKVGFNGRDNVQVMLNPMMRTHTNDISLRFKTVKTDGLLFSTSNRFQHDFMRVSLEGGRGKLETYIAGEEKVCLLYTYYVCKETQRFQSTPVLVQFPISLLSESYVE